MTLFDYSGSLGKIKKRWEFEPDEATGAALGKHERAWGEVECVQEAVEGVSCNKLESESAHITMFLR